MVRFIPLFPLIGLTTLISSLLISSLLISSSVNCQLNPQEAILRKQHHEDRIQDQIRRGLNAADPIVTYPDSDLERLDRDSMVEETRGRRQLVHPNGQPIGRMMGRHPQAPNQPHLQAANQPHLQAPNQLHLQVSNNQAPNNQVSNNQAANNQAFSLSRRSIQPQPQTMPTRGVFFQQPQSMALPPVGPLDSVMAPMSKRQLANQQQGSSNRQVASGVSRRGASIPSGSEFQQQFHPQFQGQHMMNMGMPIPVVRTIMVPIPIRE